MFLRLQDTVYASIARNNAAWKVDILTKYLEKNEKVLDFGCGDLSFTKQLLAAEPTLTITGIDVVNFDVKHKKIKFVWYNGEKMPFKDNAFDTIIIFYVLHHCDAIDAILQECVRVTKKRLLIVESVPHALYEIPFMRFFDWMCNVWKPGNVPLPYQFLFVSEWLALFKHLQLKVVTAKQSDTSLLAKLPIGKLYVFEVTKKSFRK